MSEEINTNPGEDVVTQEDREAAAALSEEIAGKSNGRDQIAECRAGKQDATFLVQAFRNHRVNSAKASPFPDMTGELVEALERVLADLEEDIRWAEASDLERLICRRDRIAALLAARGAA